jgi:hypothetical protein
MSLDELTQYTRAEGFGRTMRSPAYESSDEEENYISPSDEYMSSDEESATLGLDDEDFEAELLHSAESAEPGSRPHGPASPLAAAAAVPALSPAAGSPWGDEDASMETIMGLGVTADRGMALFALQQAAGDVQQAVELLLGDAWAGCDWFEVFCSIFRELE